MVIVRSIFLSAAACALAACNVSATAPATTGGVDAGDAGPACDQGAVVVLSDYTSTQIALASRDGEPMSSAFLSTASTKASGLAFALSGDVVVPTSPPPSGRVVLLDRYGTNVITWADPATAKVLAQLPVGTGFESNPQDYVELDDAHAYVSRWGVNDAPSSQPFDRGSDVLAIDTRAPAITASVAMPVEDGLPPRPSGMVRVGGTVIVVLQRMSEDFATQGESALVGIANGAIAWQMRVTGLKGCGAPALAPSGTTFALACEGELDANGDVADLGASAIVLFDATKSPPVETKRVAVQSTLGAGAGDRVAFASESLLFGKTQTPQGGAPDNAAFSVDLASGAVTSLASATKSGIQFGDVYCEPGCGDVCLLADGASGKLRRWKLTGGALAPMDDVTVDTAVGLPPIGIGGF